MSKKIWDIAPTPPRTTDLAEIKATIKGALPHNAPKVKDLL